MLRSLKELYILHESECNKECTIFLCLTLKTKTKTYKNKKVILLFTKIDQNIKLTIHWTSHIHPTYTATPTLVDKPIHGAGARATASILKISWEQELLQSVYTYNDVYYIYFLFCPLKNLILFILNLLNNNIRLCITNNILIS